MKNINKLLIIIGLWILGVSMVAQGKAPCSYIAQISPDAVNNMALSDYFYDNESKIYYRIVNDNNSLGVLIKMDKESGRDLFMRGLEVWVNEGNKKKKNNGIKFPIPQMPTFDQNDQSGPKENAEMILQSAEMEVTGFGYSQVQIVPSENDKSIHGKINIGTNNMIDYQIIIPLDKLKETIAINKTFSVLLNWGEFKRPENGAPSGDRPSKPEMGNGQMPPPGGQPGGNNMPGQGGPGMRKGTQDMDIMVRDISLQKD